MEYSFSQQRENTEGSPLGWGARLGHHPGHTEVSVGGGPGWRVSHFQPEPSPNIGSMGEESRNAGAREMSEVLLSSCPKLRRQSSPKLKTSSQDSYQRTQISFFFQEIIFYFILVYS